VTAPVRRSLALLLFAILALGGFYLLRGGMYGLTVFVLIPILLGALATWVVRPATPLRAAGTGALAVTGALFSLLLVRVEGLGCLIMVLPLAIPLGAIGGMIAWRSPSSKLAARGGAAMLLLLPPATLTWDSHAKPPVFEVRTSIEIAAPPEQVWRHVVTFSELPEPDEWFFRAGLAYPKRARIEGSGVGAVRYCEFSTGPFVEPIEVWNEPRLLRFRVTENPAPMHEWSPYSEVLPRHLHGYLVSEHGQFRLTPLPDNRTLLEGTTWYRHGLWPAEYWRWWSDAIIHRIHEVVLEHIKAKT
jgi:uncharacterized protein YndB with AHSA1/START domain